METTIGIVVFLVVTVAGAPSKQTQSERCNLAAEQEQCSSNIEDAFSGFKSGGLSSGFDHFCKSIPDFVPCLEANKGDYLLLFECDSFITNLFLFKDIFAVEKTWNMSIAFFNAGTELACSRTDELVNLIECVQGSKKSSNPREDMTCNQHLSHSSIEKTIKIADCNGLYGFFSCWKDELVGRCGSNVEAILETAYDDIIAGVIGESIGCEK